LRRGIRAASRRPACRGDRPRYRKILALSPALHLIRNNLGHALAQQGEIDAAMDEYRRAVEIKSDYPDALCTGVQLITSLDQLDEAGSEVPPGDLRSVRTSPAPIITSL